jgi:hypothetical protein
LAKRASSFPSFASLETAEDGTQYRGGFQSSLAVAFDAPGGRRFDDKIYGLFQ